MFAQVIVDVPAKPVNRPFDYRVPPEMASWITIGSRVGVPFGPRLVQGFVVGLTKESALSDKQLRDISAVLDPVAPLNEELIRLGKWMSSTYLCHEVVALQAMLPGALKAKYEKKIAVNRAVVEKGAFSEREADIIAYVDARKSVSAEQLIRQFPDRAAQVNDLLRREALVASGKIKDQSAGLKANIVLPPADPKRLADAINSLPGTAKRQRQVLEFVRDMTEPQLLGELVRQLGVGSASVKSLAEKGAIVLQEIAVYRDPYDNRQFMPTRPLPLTAEQQRAYAPIAARLRANSHEVFLLHGVTGSGKTEIYLQLIAECLRLGREAIVLVPEISLTPQMVERFKGRFGDDVAVMHSRLSDGERYDEWRKILHGKAHIAIGARSAVFAPFRHLGLIIIDEEHEASYKQEDNPKYDAREVAVIRGKYHGGVVLLGSATPSLESYSRAVGEQADYRYLPLFSRVKGRPLPAVQIVDMRNELRDGNRSMFSRPLYRAIGERLRKREQTVLLLNRRGYATFILCRSCGYVANCPHCDISLTYHRPSHTVRCHMCGYAEREMAVCPSCGSEHIRYFGTGTQRVEEELTRLFPGIRVLRMDVDTTNTKGAHEKLLNRFRQHHADVLLGTQMVAKGLDFPLVTLVGVITADTILHLPDFRAAEKTFQLVTQVAGRAGRHQLPGEVIVQTYNPDHYSIRFAQNHDYRAFAQNELALRKARDYPPFSRLILLTLTHENPQLIATAGEKLAAELKLGWERQRRNTAQAAAFAVYGPVAAPIPRIKDRYRFQCVIKYRGELPAQEIVADALAALSDIFEHNRILASVDVDPQMMM
ncbi:MAG TPA: primosomal protein N' [Bacilli bacterium]